MNWVYIPTRQRLQENGGTEEESDESEMRRITEFILANNYIHLFPPYFPLPRSLSAPPGIVGINRYAT